MDAQLCDLYCFVFVMLRPPWHTLLLRPAPFYLFLVSYPDQIDEKKRNLNEKLDVLSKKKHDLVQMLKQVLLVHPCFSG